MSVSEPENVPLLSVCMIVKDEEKNLERALASASGLEAELLVVDTGSADDTVDVARRAGARVVHFPWVNDFSAARNFGFSHARGRWLLVLDADEELTATLRENVARVLGATRAGGIRVSVSSVDDRGNVRMSASSTRFVRNGMGYAYEGRVHEDVEGSILRAGGAIEECDLPLVHHGYTSAEDARKQRHSRNMKLVTLAHEASPTDARVWHYLGLEHAIAGDHELAARWFERVVSERPSHELAGWSASQLASIRIGERALGAAWEAAIFGSRARLGRVSSLLHLGTIALRDGDARAALQAAAELDKLPARVEGDNEHRRASTVVLKARAGAANGGLREAYGLLVRAVKSDLGDAMLADELVKMAEQLDPSGRPNVTAAKDTRGAASVIAAGIGTFVRRRAWSHAISLGEMHGVQNEYLAHALLRVGRVEEARAMLVSFGEAAAAHLLLSGLETNDAATLDRALEMLAPRMADAANHVVTGQRVPRALGFCVLGWMELGIAFRADALVERLARSLPGTNAEGRATLALLRYEGGEPMEALREALTCASEPDALEVIGLVAETKGDHEAAAMMLSRRARAGDVSVRVVLRGCAALKAMGNRAAAEELLAIGRASRPHASSLRAK